jgi:hypothetical protein
MAARRIGAICKSIRPHSILDSDAHLSVTSSGELDYTIAKGAQAKAVLDHYREFITQISSETKIEQSPLWSSELYRRTSAMADSLSR